MSEQSVASNNATIVVVKGHFCTGVSFTKRPRERESTWQRTPMAKGIRKGGKMGEKG